MKRAHELVIVGGGAAGMMAAIQAAKRGIDTAVLEGNELPGKKLLATGNGKCNFTNRVQRLDCYRGGQPKVAMQLLERYPVEKILACFEEIGILSKERNGYVYPYSEQAAAVRDAMELAMRQLGVTLYTSCHVEAIVKEQGSFRIRAQQRYLLADAGGKGKTQNKKKPPKPVFSEPEPVAFTAKQVILATGGNAGNIKGADGSGYALAQSLGLGLIQPVPALVQLTTADAECALLAGVRLDAAATLQVGDALYQEQGEFLFTDYGISGIPVLQLSRYAACALLRNKKQPKVKLYLDFFPNTMENSLKIQFAERFERFAERTDEQKLIGVLPAKLNPVVLKRAGLEPERRTVGKDIVEAAERLAGVVKRFELTITGTNAFEFAQVTAGGVPMDELESQTLESRCCKGLYIVGELADMDGTCGGYNLQWAWMSAMAAVDAIAAEHPNVLSHNE